MLPEMDGFALCREIRKESDIPIVMLTARGDVMDRVVGLELGADDYLPKPFEPRELVARVQTILRRQRAVPAPAAAAQRRVFEGLAIDLDKREVLRQGERVELTGTEFELLALLADQPGKVFSRDDILNRLRGHEAELYTRAVDIVVSRLRKKLEPLDCIKTLRNAGYTLAVGKGATVRRAARARERRRWRHRWRHSLRAAPDHRVRAAGAGDGGGVPGRHAAAPSPAAGARRRGRWSPTTWTALVAELGTPPDVARAQALVDAAADLRSASRARRSTGIRIPTARTAARLRAARGQRLAQRAPPPTATA